MKSRKLYPALLLVPFTACWPAVAQIVDGATQVPGAVGQHSGTFHLRVWKTVPEIAEYRRVASDVIQQITRVKEQVPDRYGVHYIVPGHRSGI